MNRENKKRKFNRIVRRLLRRFFRFVRRYKFACATVGAVLVIAIAALSVVSCSKKDDTATESTLAKTGNEADSAQESSDDGGGFFSFFTKKDDSIQDGANEVETPEEDPTLLAYNPDTKEGYMNNCIFLGDSRTVAMVSYGFISDDSALAKVGIAHTAVESTTFVNNAGKEYTLQSYLMSHQAPVVFVCYGVNGMNGLAEDKYKSSYEKLVDHIVEMAPNSNVVLMSIWPVDDYGTYKNSVKNEWIVKYNKFLYEMAENKGLHYLNVSEILTDSNGQMLTKYDAGDGLHYRSSAYTDILKYIVSHPVPGVSDDGDFVVKYVKPTGDYKKMVNPEVSLSPELALPDPATLLQPEVTTNVETEEQRIQRETEEQRRRDEERKRQEEEEARKREEQRKAEEAQKTPAPTPTPTPTPTTTPTQSECQHEYVNGICKHCNTPDPNYVSPEQPTTTPEQPTTTPEQPTAAPEQPSEPVPETSSDSSDEGQTTDPEQ